MQQNIIYALLCWMRVRIIRHTKYVFAILSIQNTIRMAYTKGEIIFVGEDNSARLWLLLLLRNSRATGDPESNRAIPLLL